MAATVRPAVPEDASTIADVHVHAWRVAYAALLPAEVLAGLDVAERTRMWRDWIADPSPAGGACWVAAEEGVVVGFASTAPCPHETAVAPDALELRALYLRPEVIGRGVGRELLDVALAHAEVGGAPEMVTWVFEENHRAIRFYEAGGFETDGRIRPRAMGGTGPMIRRLRRPFATPGAGSG